MTNLRRRLARLEQCCSPPAAEQLSVAYVDADGRVLDTGSEAVRPWVGRHSSELPGPLTIGQGVDPLVVQRTNPTTKGRASLRPHPNAERHHVAAGRVAEVLPATPPRRDRREEEVRPMRASAVLGAVQGEVGAEDGGVCAAERQRGAADARGPGDGGGVRERPGADGRAHPVLPEAAPARVRVSRGERMGRKGQEASAHPHPGRFERNRPAGTPVVGSVLAERGEGVESLRANSRCGCDRPVHLQGHEERRGFAPAGLQGEALHRLTGLLGSQAGGALERGPRGVGPLKAAPTFAPPIRKATTGASRLPSRHDQTSCGQRQAGISLHISW
jgi:hypothetical protein